MRAVKTKLRKGNYVVMLTQFDSLGGMGFFALYVCICLYVYDCMCRLAAVLDAHRNQWNR